MGQRRLGLLVVLAVLLALPACSIQGGLPASPAAAPTAEPAAATVPAVEPTALPAPAGAEAPIQTAASVTVGPATIPAEDGAPPVVVEASNWTIGLLDEPGSLLPFSPDGRAAAPIVQAMFPAPVLGLSYAFTTTGILTEIPTQANGGVELIPVSGYLDATSGFTTTVTGRPTTTTQLAVTFRWNPALRWADGAPVTAADSVFAYESARETADTPEMAALLDAIQLYEALDEHTTRALLAPGRADWSYPLAAWPPAPRHMLEGASPEERTAYARAPLGYGPYTFDEVAPDATLVLQRNRYWPKQSIPEQLRFQFFESAEDLRAAVNGGDVDVAVLERIPPDLLRFLDQDAASGTSVVQWVRGPVYEHLDFNLAEPLLQDLRVRRAIAHAINRRAIADQEFGGKANILQSWIFPDQPAYAGDEQLTRYAYAPPRARALLEEAGFVDSNGDGVREAPSGEPLALTLLTTDTSQRVALSERIVADLQAVGLAVRSQALPVDQLYAPTGPLFRRDFQLALFGWLGGVDPGGVPLWSCAAVPGEENGYTGNNFGGWCFEPAEQALRQATAALDPLARAAAYLRHQQLWSQEVPSIALLQRPIAILSRPELQGLVPDPLAPITWNVDDWHR